MVTTTPSSESKTSYRLRVVDEHVGFENEHDLDGIMRTFGDSARYDDEPWNAHYVGRAEVRGFYTQLLRALPDLHIGVQRRHAGEDAVVLEVVIRGRHLGSWRGLPATGRRVEFPLCGVYTFDADNRLAGERIYYDRATVLEQLRVFHEPASLPGRIALVLTHPVTMAAIAVRKGLASPGIALAQIFAAVARVSLRSTWATCSSHDASGANKDICRRNS